MQKMVVCLAWADNEIIGAVVASQPINVVDLGAGRERFSKRILRNYNVDQTAISGGRVVVVNMDRTTPLRPDGRAVYNATAQQPVVMHWT